MRDVAALAGVSLKSVSRVVNDEPGVTDALARKVSSAVAELGYRHNLTASHLRRGQRTASIGVLVQDLSNDFCSAVLRAIEDRARARGVVVMASSIDEDTERERETAHGLVARRIDGLILMPASRSQDYLEHDLAAGLAVVAVDRRPLVTEIDAVVADNQGGSAEAVGHLIARGHRRIAFLGDSEAISTAVERRDGYRMALRASRIARDPLLERMDLRTQEDATQAAREVLALDDPPTAIFAARNVICTGTVLALQALSLSHQVALVGFDEVAVAELVEPRVTVVRQDTHTIGATAFDRLLARLDGDDSPAIVEVVPTSLVTRGSGEIRPPGRSPEPRRAVRR
ncbi:MAG: LacI family DNA-binding transcriptional regulator [Marmoricola sp.]